MSRFCISHLIFSFLFFSPLVIAQEATAGNGPLSFDVSADAIFPIFVGAKANLAIREHYEFGLGLGIVPEPFYNVIGQVAASLGENDSYDDVINSAFANNQIVRLNFQYNFSGSQGWRAGFAGSVLNSKGDAEIDTVLGAATGRDYTNLKNLLVLAGRDTTVDMTGTLQILEIYGGYAWSWTPDLFIEVTAGIGKVITSDLTIETGLASFEASVAGSSLLRATESDLEQIVNDYGISPIVGGSLHYSF